MKALAHKSIALPSLSARMAIRLLQVIPHARLDDLSEVLTKLKVFATPVASSLTATQAIKKLSAPSELSHCEQRLQDNINRLCDLFDLSDFTSDVLLLLVLNDQNNGIQQLLSMADGGFEQRTMEHTLCALLDIEASNLITLFAQLYELGFIDEPEPDSFTSNRLPDFIRLPLQEGNITDKSTLLAPLLTASAKPQFRLADFEHVNHSLMVEYFHNASLQHRKGISVMLHGESGTGKTEFARALATALGRNLYDVRATQINSSKGLLEFGHRYASDERLKYLNVVQDLMGTNHNAILLIDECESLFEQADGRYTKERLQRFIECNNVPCIWITNHIQCLEPSYVRRFKLVMQISPPPKSQLETIVDKASKGLRLSRHFKQQWASMENLTPAMIDNACDVAKTVHHSHRQAEATVTEVAESTLHASGLLVTKSIYQGEMAFDKSLLNIKSNKSRIREIEYAVKNSMPIRVLLTGPPGTGKTAYAHALAQDNDKPLIRISTSDVLSKYVGESEQQISALFQRACDEQAILLFDEVDSLLANRQQLHAHHEVQLVNELLAQLECNTQPVFAATNYADKLDHAVLRRFDIKLHCNYLTTQQSCVLFKRTLNIARLTHSEQCTLNTLTSLTPGDFAIVARHQRFNRSVNFRNQALSLLVDENHRKQGKPTIGFIAT